MKITHRKNNSERFKVVTLIDNPDWRMSQGSGSSLDGEGVSTIHVPLTGFDQERHYDLHLSWDEAYDLAALLNRQLDAVSNMQLKRLARIAKEKIK